MTGPAAFSRQMRTIDALVRQTPDLDGLGEQLFGGAGASGFTPEDPVKLFLGGMYGTAQGRAVLEWIADLTLRAAPGHSGQTLEAAAIAHAKHEARFAVGQAIFAAVAQGYDLLNVKEPP